MIPATLTHRNILSNIDAIGQVYQLTPKDVLVGEADFRYPDKVDLPGYQPTSRGNMVQIRRQPSSSSRRAAQSSSPATAC